MISLRPYQERAVDQVRKSFRVGNDAPLLVGPTGMGKTVIFSFISNGVARRKMRVMIVAHRYELLDQISQALERFDLRHGIISPGYSPDYRAPVQVAGVQALASRLKKEPDKFRPDLLIIDEAHHVLPSNSWGRVFHALGQPKLLGVTASPVRLDGRGLGKVAGGLFDDLIDVVSVAELIEEGYLVKPVVYGPGKQLDLSGLDSRGGDYEKEALEDRVDKPTITGDAVAHYSRICPGLPAVVFGVSINHCTHIAEQFRAAGYRFEVVDGSMEKKRRRALIGGLGKEITGLVSCDLVGEGVDIPEIGCAILLRPTQSLGLHVQQMGRSLRPIYPAWSDLSTTEGRLAALKAAGKEKAWILDHVGNWERHGLPETEREWTLDGRQKRPKTGEPPVAIRQCVKCYGIFRPAPVCPHCGEVQPIIDREIENVDGELAEITPEMVKAVALQKKIEVARAKSLDDLRAIGTSRRYSPEWADHVWASRERKTKARVEGQMAAYGYRGAGR